MTLEEKIFQDYKDAMKARDTAKSGALSFLRAELNNYAIELQKKALDDKDVITVIRRQVKRLEEAIEMFKKGNRQDLVDKESKGLAILQAYLPKQISEAEIVKIVEEIIKAKGVVSMKDMGAIMKEVMAKTGGAADGKVVSEIVRTKLNPPKP